MSVDIEQVGQSDYWRITAEPDSGKAYWRVEVYADRNFMYPMRRVLVAVRRAIRIDREFSLEQIEKRGARRQKRQVATRLVAAALAAREEQELSEQDEEENVA